MYQRAFLRLAALLSAAALLTLFLPVSAAALAPEDDLVHTDALAPEDDLIHTDALAPEGWLIHADTLPSELPEVESILPGVYRTESRAVAERMRREGALIEPDQTVSLPAMTAEKTQTADWSYNAMGGPRAERLGLSGKGVRIAVIDSGVLLSNPNLAKAKILSGKSYVGGAMTDEEGHGTYVCQCIAGWGWNGAVRGIAPDAELVPLRCFAPGIRTQFSTLARAVRDAVDLFSCDIINMSWGSSYPNLVLQEALNYARDKGVLLIAAAGNVESDYPQGTLIYPAAFGPVIGVGAIRSDNAVSYCSQQTAAVSLCAPGDQLTFCSLSGTYTEKLSGTSFAAPSAAAAAALVMEALPQLDAASVRRCMEETSMDLGVPGPDVVYGHGSTHADALFGTSWFLQTSKPEGLQLDGWFAQEGGGTLMSADYFSTGRMRSCECVSVDSDFHPLQLSLPDTARLFFTDSVGRALKIPIRENEKQLYD